MVLFDSVPHIGPGGQQTEVCFSSIISFVTYPGTQAERSHQFSRKILDIFHVVGAHTANFAVGHESLYLTGLAEAMMPVTQPFCIQEVANGQSVVVKSSSMPGAARFYAKVEISGHTVMA